MFLFPRNCFGIPGEYAFTTFYDKPGASTFFLDSQLRLGG